MGYWSDPHLPRKQLDPPAGRSGQKWTEGEIELLMSGEAVPGRTKPARQQKMAQINLARGVPRRLWRHESPYTLPASRAPGEIPWPPWWGRAQRLRAAGYRVAEISRLVGRSKTSVTEAVYADDHERRRAMSRVKSIRRAADPIQVARWREHAAGQDPEHKKLRQIARREWRQAGGDPKALEGYYRRYECL